MRQADRINNTKEAYHRALLKLMQDKPITKITVREVNDLSGYDRSTFYRYYEDIYALLDEIQNSILSDIQQIMDNHPRDTIKKTPYYFIREMFEYSVQHREAITTLFPNRVYLDLNGPILDILKETVFRNVQEVYPDADPVKFEPYFYNISGGYISILSYWLDKQNESIDEITELTTKMVLAVNKSVFE